MNNQDSHCRCGTDGEQVNRRPTRPRRASIAGLQPSLWPMWSGIAASWKRAGTLRAVKQHRRNVIDPAVAAHRGRVVKLMGDGILVEFISVVDAVNCATEIQQQTAEGNAGLAPDRRIELRIGINLGDVIVEGEDIYGDGVNVAVRLQGLAQPGGAYRAQCTMLPATCWRCVANFSVSSM
jgi:Adenylate and Guanylate cyclase catalytic domain